MLLITKLVDVIEQLFQKQIQTATCALKYKIFHTRNQYFFVKKSQNDDEFNCNMLSVTAKIFSNFLKFKANICNVSNIMEVVYSSNELRGPCFLCPKLVAKHQAHTQD